MPLDDRAADRSRDLVASAREGDRASLERLLEAQLPALRAFVRLRMGSLRRREESSDVLQSTCRQVLQSLGTFEYRGEAEFRDWLFTAALNKLTDKGRRQHADCRDVDREVHLGDGPSNDGELEQAYAFFVTPSRHAVAREHVQRLEAAFDALPEPQREVILLSRLVQLPHAEIGRRLGRSEGAVRNLLYRGLARLSWLLDRGGSGSAPAS